MMTSRNQTREIAGSKKWTEAGRNPHATGYVVCGVESAATLRCFCDEMAHFRDMRKRLRPWEACYFLAVLGELAMG
jgi:hypothetical protein